MKPIILDIDESYQRIQTLIWEYYASSSEEPRILIRKFQEQVLCILANLSGQVPSLSEGKTGKNAEDKTQELIERFAKRYKNITQIPTPNTLLNMDDFLQDVSSIWAELLARNIIKIPFQIHPIPVLNSHDILPWDRQGWESVKTAPKYTILINILMRHDIEPRNIAIVEETLEENQPRHIPYRIVYIRTRQGIRTICISDQIGEQTYLYQGMADLAYWTESQKWQPIYDMPIKWVEHWEYYEENLEEALFGKWEKEESITTAVSKTENLTNLLRYQSQILEAQKELANAGIICENGMWYFWDAKCMDNWPKVGEKGLKNFPSGTFNKTHDIGNNRWVTENIGELSKMFSALWLRVATEEEEKKRWAKMLEDTEKELAEAGIVYENGMWYFWDAKGMDKWPKMGGRNLRNFPNAPFNKDYGIGNNGWAIHNIKELSKMFAALWLRVATEREEKKRWAKMLENAEKELAEAGIVYEGGMWYFWDTKGHPTWPKIWGKNLRNFPNAPFNKTNGISDNRWVTQNLKELSKIFSVLWLRVATEEEERIHKTKKKAISE